MKKAIVLLLALAVLGSAAFAQELKFSGYLDTGVAIFDTGANNPTLGLWGDDSGQNTRLNFQGAYTNENVGATFRMRMQGDIDTGSAGNVFVNRAFVWANLFDNMAKIQVGKLGDYTWASFGKDTGNFDTLTGLQLQVMPVAGLNFGFFLPAEATKADRVVLEKALKDVAFGASYALDGFGAFRAGYDMSAAEKSDMLYVSVKMTAVENLVVVADAKFSNLGDKDKGVTALYQGIDYTMDALNFGIDLDQTLAADSDIKPELAFGPYVEYDMGAFLPGFAFTYTMQDKASDMWFNPYLKHKVGPKALVELGAKFNFGDLEDDAYRYYAAFTWSF